MRLARSAIRSAPCLERALFALAGTVVLVGAALSALVSSWFLVVVAFVGLNQWLYVVAGACPASLMLKRVCGLEARCGR